MRIPEVTVLWEDEYGLFDEPAGTKPKETEKQHIEAAVEELLSGKIDEIMRPNLITQWECAEVQTRGLGACAVCKYKDRSAKCSGMMIRHTGRNWYGMSVPVNPAALMQTSFPFQMGDMAPPTFQRRAERQDLAVFLREELAVRSHLPTDFRWQCEGCATRPITAPKSFVKVYLDQQDQDPREMILCGPRCVQRAQNNGHFMICKHCGKSFKKYGRDGERNMVDLPSGRFCQLCSLTAESGAAKPLFERFVEKLLRGKSAVRYAFDEGFFPVPGFQYVPVWRPTGYERMLKKIEELLEECDIRLRMDGGNFGEPKCTLLRKKKK